MREVDHLRDRNSGTSVGALLSRRAVVCLKIHLLLSHLVYLLCCGCHGWMLIFGSDTVAWCNAADIPRMQLRVSEQHWWAFWCNPPEHRQAVCWKAGSLVTAVMEWALLVGSECRVLPDVEHACHHLPSVKNEDSEEWKRSFVWLCRHVQSSDIFAILTHCPVMDFYFCCRVILIFEHHAAFN